MNFEINQFNTKIFYFIIKANIHLITDWITNEISSTKIRRAVQRNESIKYLINNDVIKYINVNNLYK